VLCKDKERIFCVQVKNKPWVVKIILHLIPWKSPRSSETSIYKGQFKKKQLDSPSSKGIFARDFFRFEFTEVSKGTIFNTSFLEGFGQFVSPLVWFNMVTYLYRIKNRRATTIFILILLTPKGNREFKTVGQKVLGFKNGGLMLFWRKTKILRDNQYTAYIFLIFPTVREEKETISQQCRQLHGT
jgi:hypothetical protein